MASALADAHAGDQVWVKTGTYTGSFIGTDGVAVYGGFAGTETSVSQRNITANPTILDGGTHRTPYTILSSATHANSIDGFTVQNGYTTGNGGGLLDSSVADTLNVANCTLMNNSAGNGGGLSYTGTSLTISDSTFTSNSVGDYGGGIYYKGTALTVNNSTFTSNSAAVYGGGIYCSGVPLTVSGTTFTGNAAGSSSQDGTGAGGGVEGNFNGIFTHCMFMNNTTYGGVDGGFSGGGISCEGTLTLNTCTFSENSASGNDAVGGGGGVAGSTVAANNCTFSGNTVVEGNYGGGIYASSVTVMDSTFTSNTVAGGSGGAISCVTFSASGSMFNSNSASAGGAISGGGTATDCIFDANSAKEGGGIYGVAEGAYFVTAGDCTFTNNTAKGGTGYDGGGIYAYGSCNIEDDTFQGNSPSAIYGNSLGSSTATSLILDNLIIGMGTSTSNPVDHNGIDVNTISNGQVSYLTIANNTITNTNVGIFDNTGSGTVTVANNIYYANYGGLNNTGSDTFLSYTNDNYTNVGYNYQGVATGPTDLAVNPVFVDASTGNYQLAMGSPLINAGTDAYVNPGDTDLNGHPRINGSHVDIGAYEYTNPPVPLSVTFSPAMVCASAMTTVTVTLAAITPPGGSVVTLTSSNPTAAPVPATITVAAGMTTATFKITAGNITATTNVTITAALNGTSAMGTLTVAPQGIASVTLSSYTITGGDALTGEVTLLCPALANTTVTLAPGGSDSVPVSVTIPKGGSTATFTVLTSVVPAKIGASVTATLSGKSVKQGFTLLPPQVTTLSPVPNAVMGGTPVSATLLLSVPAPSGGITVNLTSSNPNVASVPASVMVPAGSYTATFPVTTYAVAGYTKVTISGETTALVGAASLTLLP